MLLKPRFGVIVPSSVIVRNSHYLRLDVDAAMSHLFVAKVVQQLVCSVDDAINVYMLSTVKYGEKWKEVLGAA